MDHEGEDCIAVGSTGTLLSLMGKEMEILQARKSCSDSYNNMQNYKKSPYSGKDPNTLYASYSILGFPSASPLMNPPSTNIVSSLWSDLKGLLRSPTSIYHTNNIAHTPLISHNNTLSDINEDSGALCIKSPSQSPPLRPLSHPSPLRTPSHPSPRRATYPKQGIALHSHAPAPPLTSPSSKDIFPNEVSAAVLDSCPSLKASIVTYPKETVATEAISYSNQKSSLDLKKHAHYPHGKSPLHNFSKERLAAAGAADYPNRLHCIHSQARSDIASTSNRKDTDVYQVMPTGIDQDLIRKGSHPAKERSLAGAGLAAAKHYPKGKNMDAASPSLQYPTYPKAKAMDAVYAMRRSSAASNAAHSESSKLLQELEAKEGTRISRNSTRCSRKREPERATKCSKLQDETYCTQKREERGYVQKEYACMQKREEREGMQDEYWCRQRREERVYCMQEMYYECCMQTPMLEERPLNMRPSRSFGGRAALPLVSIVDLQCCHSADRSSTTRLSFTRLSSF